MSKLTNTVNPTTESVVTDLEKLGLTNKQAKIYSLLITHGELRIQEISDLCQIPRSSVYEDLKTLFELGLIEKILNDKFIKVKPYPISSMRHGIEENMHLLKDKVATLSKLEQSLPIVTPVGSLSTTIIRYYKGKTGAQQLLWNTLKTKSVVYVYSAWGRGRYVGMKFYESFVKESKDRQIKEQVLVNPIPRVTDSISKYINSSTSRTAITDIRGLNETQVLVKGETFIYDNIFSLIYLHDEEINGFEIESQNFTEMQRSIFESLWKTAKPISEFLPK